jgi:hypothetical protein
MDVQPLRRALPACQPAPTLGAAAEQSVDNLAPLCALLAHRALNPPPSSLAGAQCRSGRMTLVRMIASLMANWRSSSLTSCGSAVRLITA